MKSMLIAGCITAAGLSACNTHTTPKAANTFGEDVAFLKQHLQNVIVLKHPDSQSQVVVTGDYQARVMTSTTGGDAGNSYGWINYNLVASHQLNKHINAFGGEERFWLGPEGGQYGLYFPPGKPFDFDNWQTPPLIDTVHYQMVAKSDTSVSYEQSGVLQNYQGSSFPVKINRTVSLLGNEQISSKLGFALPGGINGVAYETSNTVTNTGDSSWQPETGLLSIWLLGMFRPSDQTAIVAPFKGLPNANGYITDDYFGKIAAKNLQVKDSLLLFRADGKSRGKLGLSPVIAKPGAGSIDLEHNTLTVLLYEIVPDGKYVNSKWEIQKEPYKGDAVNCYNDGPIADGSQMGPFYEVESSSAAQPLKPGESMSYRQTTMHFQGDRTAIQALAKELWQLSLDDVQHFLNNK